MHQGVRELSIPLRRRRRALAVLASTFLVSASIGVVSTDAASFKPFEVDGLPGLNGAMPGPTTLSIRNLTTTQQLGSLQITLSGGATFTAVGPNGTLASAAQAVFQNLNIPATQSASVTFTVAAPCGSSRALWTFAAQQANQWVSGNGANYLTLAEVTYADKLAANNVGTGLSKIDQPNPSNYVNSSCQLVFKTASSTTPAVAGAQVYGGAYSAGTYAPTPTAAQTLSADHPGATLGVKVGLYDPVAKTFVTTGAFPVTVALTGGSSGALLGGATTVSLSDGVATFTDLTVNKAGLGYALTATSSYAQPGTSNSFNVDPIVQACDQSLPTCTVNWPAGDPSGVTSSITAYNPTAANYFGGAVNPSFSISCAGAPFSYQDSPDPSTNNPGYDPSVTWYYYGGPNSSTKTVVLTIPKAYVQITPNNGTSFYQICYAATGPTVAGAEFQTNVVTNVGPDGTYLLGGTYALPAPSSWNLPTIYAGVGWYYGTLPWCANNGDAAPCLVSKDGTGGNRVLTFKTPALDPIYR